ncbi:hypothetical protein KBB27_02315 [Patescibacteria group bacterium]|nr:hypothetical protein [Patescibacteria group bacterium]
MPKRNRGRSDIFDNGPTADFDLLKTELKTDNIRIHSMKTIIYKEVEIFGDILQFFERSVIELIDKVCFNPFLGKKNTPVNGSSINVGFGEKVSKRTQRRARMTSGTHVGNNVGMIGTDTDFTDGCYLLGVF